MTDEVNPMRDLGFFPDKQVIVEPQGFIVAGNPTRDLCAAFIPDGAKFYDLLDRYENITTYVLNRTDTGSSGDVMRLAAPFLKAFGATDFDVMKFFRENLTFNPGAKDVLNYLRDLMPLFLNTVLYQHAAEEICERMDIEDCLTGSSVLDLDHAEMQKEEARRLRKIAAEIVKLKLPGAQYEFSGPLELSNDEVKLVTFLDEVLLKHLQGTEAQKMVGSTPSVGANEKACTLLDIRKSTQIDLEGTAYVGGDTMDFQVLDLVRDGSGLAISFNGSEFAVRGCNVMVLSGDCTVVAFLLSVFYDTGIQGVFDLVEHWSKDFLKKHDFPDNNLRDAVLNAPGKFPEVRRVTRANVDEMVKKSDLYRSRLMRSGRPRPAGTAGRRAGPGQRPGIPTARGHKVCRCSVTADRYYGTDFRTGPSLQARGIPQVRPPNAPIPVPNRAAFFIAGSTVAQQ